MPNNVKPSDIVSLQEFYQFAKKNTPIETWDYIIGAADTETTFKKNRYSSLQSVQGKNPRPFYLEGNHRNMTS